MAEEFDFEVLDAEEEGMIEALCEQIEQDEQRTAVMNLPRMKQMQIAYAMVKQMKLGADKIKLSYQVNQPYQSMGNITLEGKMLEFVNPKWFTFAASLANNTEVYTLTKNKVRLTFTFHNLTVPIE